MRSSAAPVASRHVAAWRLVALVFIVLAAVQTVADAVHGNGGTFGFAARQTAIADQFLVQTVAPRTAAVTGLRAGDIIRLDPGGIPARLTMIAANVGSRLTVQIERSKMRRTVTLVAVADEPPPLVAYLFVLFQICSLAVALLVVVRCAHRYEGRLLAGLLTSFAFSVSSSSWYVLPIALAASFFKPIATGFAFASTAAFPTAFPVPAPASPRRLLGRVAWGGFAIVAALSMYVTGRHLLLGLHVPGWTNTVGNIVTLLDLTVLATALGCSLRESRGADRIRVHWISASLAVGLSGPLVLIAAVLAGLAGGASRLGALYLASTMIVIPFGIAYALLRHRVIDIGFVFNRALVFAAVSSFIVLTLGAVEWGLGSYLVSTNHVTNSSIALAMALTLGFFLRRIHRRIDAVIDELLFRERHKTERNLRCAAREVSFVTEPEALMTFTQRALATNISSETVALYLRRTDGAFEALRFCGDFDAVVDQNDPALVRLRMTRLPVHIDYTTSSLKGALLLPMLARDGLIGVVLVGKKRDGEDFAPDERDALRELVEATGRALDALESAALRAEVTQLIRDNALPSSRRAKLERCFGSSIKRHHQYVEIPANPRDGEAPAASA